MITESEARIYADEISSKASITAIAVAAMAIAAYVINVCAYMFGIYNFFIAIPISSIVSLYIFAVIHDASHHSLIPSNRKVNDLIGGIFAFLLNWNFQSFKEIHQQHHIHANSKKDPDLIYSEQGKTKSLIVVPTLLVFLRIFIVLPKSIRSRINKQFKNKIKVYVYLYQKDKRQCRVYRFNFFLTVFSVIFFGFGSIVLFCYISSIVFMYLIHPMVSWIPHMTKFDRSEEAVNKYKTARKYNFRFNSFLLFPAHNHLEHHLFPQVQFTRLNNFSSVIKPIVYKNLEI